MIEELLSVIEFKEKKIKDMNLLEKKNSKKVY